ncbi:MAG: sigma-70 family RNA polymerase sigma factor [Xanthobacteraceae bacterium]
MANAYQANVPAAAAAACVGAGAERSTAARAVGRIRTLNGAEFANANATDESLLARVAHGDRHALELLFARHQQRVYRFVFRLVASRETAEDIVSDAFIELWRRAASFENRARLATWLLAIARNKALSALRGRVDQPLEGAAVDAIPDPAIAVDERLDASKRGAVLRKCLERLTPAHREVIDLVYYHEKSVEEVSAIIGVPAATVKTRMFYARNRLAELMKAAGIETLRY